MTLFFSKLMRDKEVCKQVLDRKDLSKRNRYYQAMIDLNCIEKGESYKNLKDIYVIFICTFDPFEKGLPKYKF